MKTTNPETGREEYSMTKSEQIVMKVLAQADSSEISDEGIKRATKEVDELLRETAVKFHSECIGEPEAIKDPEIKKHYDILFEEWITSPNRDKK